MRALTFLTLGLLAVGCSGGSGVLDAGLEILVCLPDEVDAGSSDAGWDGGLDFSCRGRAAPSGGQAELIVSGTVTQAGFTPTVLSDIRVELIHANGTVLASTTSND